MFAAPWVVIWFGLALSSVVLRRKTMKALVKSSKALGLELMDVDIPKIGANDVLIKVKATSMPWL